MRVCQQMSTTETVTISHATAEYLLQAALEAIENRDCDLQGLAALCRTIRKGSLLNPDAALRSAQQALNCVRQRNSTGAARQVPGVAEATPAQTAPATAQPIHIDLQMHPPADPVQADVTLQASRKRRITIERNGRSGAIESALVEDT